MVSVSGFFVALARPRAQITSVMSRLLGIATFLPCHSELCMVNASMVTVKCLVCTCEKHLPPELYLEHERMYV